MKIRKCSTRCRTTLLAFFALALVAPASSASAQLVFDPKVLEFDPSPDHDEMTELGEPMVSRYELQLFDAGASQAFGLMDLGRPSPSLADGKIHVSFPSPNWSVGGETYEARVIVHGPTGSNSSAKSNPFSYSASCSVGVSASSLSMPASGGFGSLTVQTSTGCQWTAIPDVSWVSVPGSTLTGAGTVSVQVAPNTSPSSRTANLVIGNQTIAIIQVGTCSKTLTTTTAILPSTASSGAVGVTAPFGCTWGTVSAAPWLQVTNGSGTGTGTVTFQAGSENPSPDSRVGTLTVAGMTVTVIQAGKRAPQLAAEGPMVRPPADTTIARPNAPSCGPGCATQPPVGEPVIRTVTNDTARIAVQPVALPAASQPVGETLKGGSSVDGMSRSIAQIAAAISTTAAAAAVAPTAPARVATTPVAGPAEARPETLATPAKVVAQTQRLSSGAAVRPFLVGIPPLRSPEGPTLERPPTSTPAPPSVACDYDSMDSASLWADTGGVGEIVVWTEVGCTWRPTTTADWITLNDGSINGSGTSTYSVAPNASNRNRTGFITIGGRTVTVRQAGVVATVPMISSARPMHSR